MRMLTGVALLADRVRVAEPGDARAITQLAEAHAAYELADFARAGHAQRLTTALQSGQLYAWLALQNHLPVGYVTATLDFSTFSAKRYLHMDCLYMSAHARGQGLGHALLQAVRDFGMAHACCNLQWQTPSWNHLAMRFYAATGAQSFQKQRYVLG